MSFRQSETASVAAAKAGFSAATAYRIEQDPRLLRKRKRRAAAGAGSAGRGLGHARWCAAQEHPACGRSPFR